ncbi:cupin domain-containing protein [Burkholderia sp. L27(2015)]|uniref:cupin domain-containing protein n=1 Tax=Burkholderia sp. L27(2015) TaxID=1641858 RepID=UPI00131D57C3|nr:cupin domain-containing protein [Burkholderia sp. L27(2015)]
MPSRPPRSIRTTPAPADAPATVPSPDESTALLGGLTPNQFMRRFWHRKPLLIRQALTNPGALIARGELLELAQMDDVQTRLIRQQKQRWQLEHGPFESEDLPSFKTRQWTLLVQGVNLYQERAHALMNQFRFIPDARLDDIMMSYATDGGGVGPHFDSYDVFLLQVHGTRRWRISAQKDLTLVPDLPLKVLQNFTADEEWVLEPGDMLYLPPHIAHDGVAVGECITCSIGFRAPQVTELQSQFLYDLAEHLGDVPARGAAAKVTKGGEAARYSDAGEPATDEPARIPAHMARKVSEMLAKIRWTEKDIEQFLGSYLSEPKQHVFFDPPQSPLAYASFVKKLIQRGAQLDLKTIFLYDARCYYINGERCSLTAELKPLLVKLANNRCLTQQNFVTLSHDSPMSILLYEWYCAGWMRIS